MEGVPPGLATLESTAHHLHVSARRLQALTAQTPLRQVAPVSLGRALGTYRLVPQLGIDLGGGQAAQLLLDIDRRFPVAAAEFVARDKELSDLLLALAIRGASGTRLC